MSGRVVLVGAGPGDPDLLTVRAAAELRRAQVLLHDALIPRRIVELAPPSCERIDVGKRGDGSCGVSQDHIAELLVAKARAGFYVVRLKGGDPFVFGRGGEEASALAAAGIPFEVVPGVSASVAAAAYAGIPITDRRYSSSFTVVTGHLGGRAIEARGGWERLALSGDTLVVMMGTRWLGEIAARLVAGGRDPATPAAVIQNGTTDQQRVVVAPLAQIAERAREAGLRSPTTVVIGEVVRLRATIDWFRPQPLRGLRVLVLRSRAQQAQTLALLEAAGALPLGVPLLELAPPEDPEPLRRALARLADYDWVLITSANTLEFWGAELAAAVQPRQRPGEAARLRVACMGGATAARARELGLHIDLVPEQSGPQGLAAALAGAGSLQGARVLLPRSAAADDELPERLRALGAKPECAVAYRNRLPAGAAEQLAAALQPLPAAVLLTSASSVQRLHELLGPDGFARLAARALFACIGESTQQTLAARGAPRWITAEQPSSAGLVAALTRYHEAHGLS